MKKIIYSLVIMIAAGSLFTSCIEQVEPLGIQDMRFAKAEYIRALKDLRAADAELQRAYAAVELANARYVDAQTANLNADTEYQKLLNEYQQLINEARQDTNDFIHNATLSAIDSLKKEIELRELTHAKAMVDAEKALAQAKEELRVAIRNINLAAGDLTGPEKVALAEAVAIYYGLTEKVIEQETKVFKAQQKVDTLTEYALRFSDTVWNGYALVDVDDYYEDAIAWEEAKIAKWMEDYEAIPDSSARVAEWKAYVDRFADRENELNYELAKIDANETAVTSLMKEGIKDFNLAIYDFIENNWEEKTAGTFTKPNDPGAPKTQADFKYNTKGDSLKIPAITVKTTDPGFIVYKQFADMVGEYDDLDADQYDVANKKPFKVAHKMAELKTDGDKVTLNVYATTAMKNFIFGNKTGEVVKAPTYNNFAGTQIKGAEAAYGIDGAISVLERQLVLAEQAGHPQAWYDSVVVAKDSIYKANRKILEDGFEKYKPYTDAKTAKENVGDGGKAEFFAAVKNLYKELEEIDGDVELNANDSAVVLAAVARYAAARDKYLDDVDGEKKPAKYGKYANPKYFYMAVGKDAEGAIVDSVLFSEINTQTRIKPVYYEYKKTTFEKQVCTNRDKGIHSALYNILNQLLPGNIGDGMNATTKIDLALSTKLTASTALLTPGYKLDSWKEASKITAPSDYVPKAVADADKAIADAKEEYIAVYEKYWGGMEYPGSPKDPSVKENREKEIPVGTYVAETFTEPYQIVTFNGDEIIWTKGLGAILSLIDPKVKGTAANALKDGSNNLVATAIFGTSANRTPFADYMKARQDAETHGALLPMKEALDKIKAWAEQVRTVFNTAIEKDGTPNKGAYEEWKEGYEPAKEAWDEYEAALIEFAGTRIDAAGDTVINDIYVITSPFKPADHTAPYPLTDVKNLFATNIVGEYVGWIETLGGEQLANAIEAFGEEPWEQFNEWNAEKAQYTAQKTDLAGLKTKAENVFKAEAKMEGYDRVESAADFEAAYKAYVQAYNALRNAIVVYDEFGNVDMSEKGEDAKVNKAVKEIERLRHEAACYKSDVPDFEGLIADAQEDLKIAEARLQALKTACEYAKANYEKLKEYILSQDASYVIPVSVADIQSLVGGLTGLLDDLGINVGDLLAAYLPGVEDPDVDPDLGD